jgi:hypothetical protein
MPADADAWEQVVPSTHRLLDRDHRVLLENDSRIDSDIIAGRGYYSPTSVQMAAYVAAGLVRPTALKAESWLAIPVHCPDGTKHGEVLRLFGSPLSSKYLWPAGKRNALIVHPDHFDDLYDTDIPLIFAEGVKKADAILSAARREDLPCVVIAINGNYGWKSSIDGGSSVASPDFLDIPLKGRHVYTTPDSDFRTNDMVRRGWSELAQYASGKTGARHVYVTVVPNHGLERQGADDYLARGGSLTDLLGSATTYSYAFQDAPIDDAPPLMIKSAYTLIEEAVHDVPHLIQPLLPEEGIMVLAGHSGTYKTWHGLQLCLDGALGLSWLDHPDLSIAEPFSSLYVNKEMGSKMLGQRLRAIARNERYAKHVDYETTIKDRIYFADEASLDLAEDVQRSRLEDAIRSLGVRLVLLDSFSMCWAGDENSSSEVGRFYSQLRGITERTGVAWILLHHLLKPTGIRKKDHVQFSVRGSGQIMQQADAGLILALSDEELRSSETRMLTAIHAKARTSLELPGFQSEFHTHGGEYVSMKYTGKVSDAKAVAANAARGDPKKMAEWVSSALVGMSAMNPTGPGIRGKQLLTLLQLQWSGASDPPSDTTLRTRLDDLVDAGDLEVLDNTRAAGGKLYRFASGESYDASLTLAANRAEALLSSEADSGEEDGED